jgi:hypothetical protein
MTKKVLMVMTLVGCLVAWSSFALATAVKLTEIGYSANAYAKNPTAVDNPGLGFAVETVDSVATMSAAVPGAQASSTAPKNSYLVHCDSSVSGTGGYADSYGAAVLAFKAPAEEVFFSFDYELSGVTTDTAEATAWIIVKLYDYNSSPIELFNKSADASSEAGSEYIPVDNQFVSASFSTTLALEKEVDYGLSLEVTWVYATTLIADEGSPTAEAYGWIKNYQLTYANNDVEPPVVDPPSAPVPGTLILLVTGLLGLAGLRRARKS